MSHFPKPFFKQARGVWYVEIARKQHNLGPDKDEGFRRYHALMAESPKERPQRVAPQSLAAIIDAFLEWVSCRRAADTYEWYRYRLERFAQRYPSLRIADLRPFHVETWVDSFKFSITSRRNYLRSVKRCLKWAKKQGYINSNPIADLEVPAGEAKEVFITQAEFSAFLAYVRNPALADLVNVTWETGCRPQESLRVEARHVDLANQRWVLAKSESKSKKNVRVIYLTEAAVNITKRLMAANPEGPLFRNSAGRPWTPDAVNSALDAVQVRMAKVAMKTSSETISEERIAEMVPTLRTWKTVQGERVEKSPAELRTEAKQKLTNKRAAQLSRRLSLYALRHSWATNALQRGVDPLTVAILMGHKDPSTLTKVYQHLSLNPEHMLEQAKRAVG